LPATSTEKLGAQRITDVFFMKLSATKIYSATQMFEIPQLGSGGRKSRTQNCTIRTVAIAV